MAKPTRRASKPSKAKHSSLRDLLSFYYPMHYRIGMDLETLMGQRRISRKQAAILWLIHVRAEDGWLPRRAIEERLSSWFEVSNSTVSNLLRELTRPPLSLVDQVESATSGREKRVRLTEEGEVFVKGMINLSVDYLAEHLAHLGDEELAWGIQFFKRAFQPLASENANATGDPLAPPPWLD